MQRTTMRLKTSAVIFFTALSVLAILVGIKTGYIKKNLNGIRHLLTSLIQNKSKAVNITRKTDLKIENFIIDRFEQLETPRKQVSIRHILEDSTILIEAAIPRGKPMEWIVWFICSDVETTGYRVVDCFCVEEPMRCTIRLENIRKKGPIVKIVFTRADRFFSTASRMAIVIADFGFTADATTVDFLSFPQPLTVSMVSTKKNSSWTAQIANEYRKEIIILLPMEPLSSNYRKYSSEAILIHYPPEKIRTLLNNAAESIPYFAGFSNLCGNMVLDDSQVMKTVLTELKKRQGYFLMEPISPRTVAASIAQSLNVPFRSIDISLDSAASQSSSLPDTLRHAAMIAQKTGSVVLQAKATSQFINALKSELPFLQRNGIRLVYLSEIMNKPEE